MKNDKNKELLKAMETMMDSKIADVEAKLQKVTDKKKTKALTKKDYKKLDSKAKFVAFDEAVLKGDRKVYSEVVKSLSTNEEAFLWLKAMRDGEKSTLKALNTGVAADGGNLVPEAWAQTIDNELREQGITRGLVGVRFMPEKTLNLPKGANNSAAFWVVEGVAITESNRTYGTTQLVAEKLASISVMTSEIHEDAIDDIVGDVTNNIVESIMLKEDDAMINGDGTAPFGNITGVLIDAGVTDVVMAATKVDFADVDAVELKALFYGVPHQRRGNAKFLMADYVQQVIDGLEDTTGRPLYRQLSDGQSGVLLGKPVVISDQAPGLADTAISTAFIAFGDFEKAVVLGDRRRITVAQTTEGTVGGNSMFELDEMAIKVTERIDMAVHLPGYMARLVTAAA